LAASSRGAAQPQVTPRVHLCMFEYLTSGTAAIVYVTADLACWAWVWAVATRIAPDDERTLELSRASPFVSD